MGVDSEIHRGSGTLHEAVQAWPGLSDPSPGSKSNVIPEFRVAHHDVGADCLLFRVEVPCTSGMARCVVFLLYSLPFRQESRRHVMRNIPASAHDDA